MLALTGCFTEDQSVCPPTNNVTINFCLPDENGYCSFLDNVFAATTAIYDTDGNLVELVESTNDHHLSFKGLRMNLPPGEYRVISWGNTGNNTKHQDLEFHYKDDAEAVVTYGEITDGKVGQCDVLYYGPNTVATRMGTGEGNDAGEYLLTVTDKGHYGTIDFRHAHRKVAIYVKNFDDGAGGTIPIVQLTDIPDGLTFGGMKPIESTDNVMAELPSEMVTIEQDGQTNTYAMAAFNAFYFQLNDHEIDVNVVNPRTGNTVYTTHLHEHIDPIEDDPDKDIEMSLLIEFLGNTDVEVTIPDWGSGDIDYGIY